MDNAALFESIANQLRLKSEMTAVLICLDEFENHFFAPKGDYEVEHVFDNLRSELAQVLKEAFLKEQVTHENQSSVNATIEALKDKLRTMRVVQLTLAFQPDESAVGVFAEWVKKNIGPATLLDLQFDKTIVGGAQIIVDGLYKDYSVRKNLGGRFQIQKDEIMSLLT